MRLTFQQCKNFILCDAKRENVFRMFEDPKRRVRVVGIPSTHFAGPGLKISACRSLFSSVPPVS